MQWRQSQSDQTKKTLIIVSVVVAVLFSYLLVIKPAAIDNIVVDTDTDESTRRNFTR